MNPLPNIDSSAAPNLAQGRLEHFPEEIGFFCRRFIWASNHTGFYTRERYFSAQNRPAWQPWKRGNGDWQHLYPKLVVDLTHKHLDFEDFSRTADPKSQVRPRENETAFWLGTMAGDRTWADCIDVDSHETIGRYGVPSRWHVDRNRHNPVYSQLSGINPYEYRFLPVVRLSLDHFRRLKQFHDHFPNRIWAFSSANLGLGLWRVYPDPIKTVRRYEVVEAQLEAVGLGGTEHYPRPPRSTGSKGKPHRRPCGMDSGVITERGVITDPIEQIRLFMAPPPTPSFRAICNALFTKVSEMYHCWMNWDGFGAHNNQRPEKVAELVEELAQVKDWLGSGCPLPKTQVVITETRQDNQPSAEIVRPAEHEPSDVVLGEQDAPLVVHGPDMFRTVDLCAINDAGQWVQFCVFLAECGFPCHDRFLEVVSTLTKWLAFYELFHLWPDRTRIKEVLRTYCLNKHNGYVTRLSNGHTQEVLAHVDRIVDHAINSVTADGKRVFAEMRWKRDKGCYPSAYRLEPLLLSEKECFESPILCGGLIPSQPDQKWTYCPDDTPLPEPLMTKIKEGFQSAKRQIRRNKAGDYPILQAITRLINYLYGGKNTGHRRASQQLLVQMGFPDKSGRRQPIKKILVKAGILYEGNYQAKKQSRLYSLSKEVITLLDHNRQVNRAIA